MKAFGLTLLAVLVTASLIVFFALRCNLNAVTYLAFALFWEMVALYQMRENERRYHRRKNIYPVKHRFP